MTKWIRLVAAAATAVTALTIGLSAAFAAGPPTPPAKPAGANAIPSSPRPPAKTETVYVAITPCRIVDTRSAGGRLSNATTRSYYVGGTSGFTSQGGRSGGCGVPVGATAVAASLTALSPAHAGFLRAWPQNLVEPTATPLVYPAGSGAGTGATLSIQKNTARSLRVKNYGGPTGLVIDVTGYYAQQIAGMVAPDGSIYAGSDRLVSAQYLGNGTYRVTFDSDVSYCTPSVNTYSGRVYGSAYGFAGTSVYVYTWRLNATTHAEEALNSYFYITLTC